MSPKKRIRTLAAYAADAVRVLNEGRQTFGSAAKLEVWLNTPHKELGNESPARLLSIAEGTERVMKELARIRAASSTGSKS